MTAAKLRLTGRHEAWHPDVRDGTLARPDGEILPVLVRPLAGLGDGSEALTALRHEARLLSRVRHPNVLRVVHVTGVAGRAALVHETCNGIGLAVVLGRLAERHERLPLRALVELAAAVATAVDAACVKLPGQHEARVVHPGPEPAEVLVDALGRVHVAGFRALGPGRNPPHCPAGYTPPEGLLAAPATAYGPGALLVELLTGEPPLPAADRPEAHEAVLRRTATRIAARVGHEGWEDLVRIVRLALAFDPEARPGPAELARELRAHALRQHSPGLRTWGPAAVPGLLRRLGRAQASQEPPALAEARAEGPVESPRSAASVADFAAVEVEDQATEMVSPELLARVRGGRQTPTAEPQPEAPPPAAALPPPPLLPARDDKAIREPRPALAVGRIPARTRAPEPGPHDAGAEQPAEPPTEELRRPDAAKAPAPAPPPDAPSPAPPSEVAPEPSPAPPSEVAPEPSPAPPSEVAPEPSPTPPSEVAPEPSPAPPSEVAPEPAVAVAEAIPGPPEPVTEELRRPPPPPDVRSIVPEAPDRFGPLGEDEPPPHRRRRPSGLWLVAPLAAGALLAIGWAGFRLVPPLLERAAPTAPEAPIADLVDALSAVPAPAADPALQVPAEPAPPAPEPAAADPAPAAPAPPEPEIASPAVAAPAPPPTATTTARREDTPRSPAAPPPSAGDAARDQAIAAIRASPAVEAPPEPPTPSAADPVPAATAPAASAPPEGSFRAEFRAGMPDVYELEVRCHQGSAKGAPPVVLNDAGKGPCRVTAFTTQSGRMIAWIGLTGPTTLTCFEGGQRTCR